MVGNGVYISDFTIALLIDSGFYNFVDTTLTNYLYWCRSTQTLNNDFYKDQCLLSTAQKEFCYSQTTNNIPVSCDFHNIG